MEIFQQKLGNTGISFNMVKVEGGTFEMGGKSWTDSSLPIHTVELNDFWIGQHLVTQEVWEAILGQGSNPSQFTGKKRPVESVSWEQLDSEFLPALNELTKANRPKGTIYCLPTEAQWEYAARGGKNSKGYEYAGGNKLDDVGWYRDNSHRETKPVGLKLPNEPGIYDMSGNVWEWCSDWYGREYYKECKNREKVRNPNGPESGDLRVRRGGSWIRDARLCRVPYRNYNHPALRGNGIGFRLVLVSLRVHGMLDSSTEQTNFLFPDK